jgi:hypothetical protein
MDRRIVVPDGTIELSEHGWGPIIRYHHSFGGGERVASFLRTITSVQLPQSIRTIRARAFAGFLALTDIVIPHSVVTIEEGAFHGLENLQTATIGNSVTRLGEGAFAECHQLNSVVLGTSLPEIERLTFEGCNSLNAIVFPPSVLSVGAGAFQGCALESLDMASVTFVGGYAFSPCNRLVNVRFTEVERIALYAFAACTSLVTLDLPNCVELVEQGAFKNCEGIKTIITNATMIGRSAFQVSSVYRKVQKAKQTCVSLYRATITSLDMTTSGRNCSRVWGGIIQRSNRG